jgi:non-specific serine/threonine protein kinase
LETFEIISPEVETGSLTSRPGQLNHPVQLTSFIGREDEIAWVGGRLEAGQRLITITGPGGVGKTRLAYAVAESTRRSGRFPDGYAVVTLASVADERLVIPTIARTLGVMADDEQPVADRLAAALLGRRMLLVVDNLEHLIGAGIALRALLDACPDLSMLVTSRRALRVTGEQEFALSPFPVPSAIEGASLVHLTAYPSIALFVDRAEAALPTFALNADNASPVVEICARLDGLPLAIELAAARIKVLSSHALASRLSGRLRILTAGPRDAPTRQQTLRETIAWSYELLAPDEQRLFRRMAVFAGGGVLAAIEAVAELDDPEADVLALVATLLDHSLLVREADPSGEPRFRMLETIREFGLELLSQTGEEASVRDAHAAHLTLQYEVASDWQFGPEEPERVRQIEPEIDNIRAALTWLLVDQEFDSPRARMGLRLARSMTRFWDLRGHLREQEEWLTLALRMTADEPTADRGSALMGLGMAAWGANRFEEAKRRHEQSLEVWKAVGQLDAIARGHWLVGLAATGLGDLETAKRHFSEIEKLIPGLGVSLWVASLPVGQGLIAGLEGDGERAMRHFAEGLAYVAEHGFAWPHAWLLGEMAGAAMLVGDGASALAYYQRSLTELAGLGDVYGMLTGVTAIAMQATAAGDPELGASLLGAVMRIRSAVGNRRSWPHIVDKDAEEHARAALGDETYGQVQARTRSMTLSEAVALALAFRAEEEASQRGGGTSGSAFELSPRELEILGLLVEGKSNQEIGDALFISPRTAGTHVSNILGKLGVHSRAAAVAMALNEGLV